MFHRLQSAAGAPRGCRSPGSWTQACSNTLNRTGFTARTRLTGVTANRRRIPRQAGCMAKADRTRAQKTGTTRSDKPRAEKPPKKIKLPKQIEHAIAAAEDKKAENLVVLDLRKAAGFT